MKNKFCCHKWKRLLRKNIRKKLLKRKKTNDKRYVIFIGINEPNGEGGGTILHNWFKDDYTFSYEEALKEKARLEKIYDEIEIIEWGTDG